MAAILTNLVRLPAVVPRLLGNIQKLQRLHGMASARRDKLAPLAYHTYDQYGKHRTTWHPAAHAWVDEKLPMSRSEYAEYCWFKKDLTRLLPLAAPVVFGPVGCLAVAAWLSQTTNLPSAFYSSEDINEIKLQFYKEKGDEARQKIGPMLQYRMKRLFRGHANQEHIWIYPELVESYKETFYSHHTNEVRDVRKCEHLKLFDQPSITLLMTNKDPIELTPKLQAQLAAAKSEEEKKAALIAAYKDQAAHGMRLDKIESLKLPENPILLGETPKDDKREPIDAAVPIENLKLTGDRVIIPNETRTAMEFWDRESHKMANEFLLLPYRFAPASWNQNRLVQWYEEMLQDDALIAKAGGVSKLSDLELKVALLDRAVMRVDEDLTRGDMEARYKEISYLMGKRLSPAVILSWQTGYFRTTYSPEDDLPESSLLPKFNRTRLDVDTINPLGLEERGNPLNSIHPALYPDAALTLKAEVKSL